MHKPVLLKETIEYIRPLPGQIIVDGTFGLGGHGREIAKLIGAQGRLIGIEQDKETLKISQNKIGAWPQIELINDNSANLYKILCKLKIKKIDGILLDLGVSSHQIETKKYGLSWQAEAPLDMRIGNDCRESALDIIRKLSEEELADLLFNMADEYRSRRIARAIKEKIDSIRTTKDLADAVAGAVGHRGKIHPATKTFQALRIAVNRELDNLTKILEELPHIIKPRRRVVIISFHSGEDRIVKHAFKNKKYWRVLTKKPVVANWEQIKINPRSRSAKLRAAERV